jgi:hypothetical protein
LKQGKASRDVNEGWKREPQPYRVNENFPSQIGSAIDPLSVEKMYDGPGYKAPGMVTNGMGQGPGANRKVRPSGGQGSY